MQYTTKDGFALHLNERAVEHISTHVGVLDMLPQAIERMRVKKLIPKMLDDRSKSVTIEFPDPVGKATVVETPEIKPYNQTTFCKRPYRLGGSRVVLLPPEEVPDVNTMTVVLKQFYDGADKPRITRVITAWFGPALEREPWDLPGDPVKSIGFWCHRAYVFQENWGSPIYTSTWMEEVDWGRHAMEQNHKRRFVR